MGWGCCCRPPRGRPGDRREPVAQAAARAGVTRLEGAARREVGQVPEEAGREVDANAMTLVASCLNVLAAKAWEALGLVPSPDTKQVERNLDDAQLAIDAAAAPAGAVRPRVPAP